MGSILVRRSRQTGISRPDDDLQRTAGTQAPLITINRVSDQTATEHHSLGNTDEVASLAECDTAGQFIECLNCRVRRLVLSRTSADGADKVDWTRRIDLSLASCWGGSALPCAINPNPGPGANCPPTAHSVPAHHAECFSDSSQFDFVLPAAVPAKEEVSIGCVSQTQVRGTATRLWGSMRL